MASFPKFLYKIVAEAPPAELPHSLPLSDLDAKDRFIHLSSAQRTPITADLFFGQHTSLWVLRVDTGAVVAPGENAELRWAEGLPGCVHIHGTKEGEMGRLGAGIIVGARGFEKKEGEDWATCMAAGDWLVNE